MGRSEVPQSYSQPHWRMAEAIPHIDRYRCWKPSGSTWRTTPKTWSLAPWTP